MSELQQSPEERRAAELVRELPRPAPDPAYRARLKRTFMAAEMAPARVVGHIGPAEPEEHRSSWATLLVPAAAGVLVVAGLLLNRGPGWQVLGVTGGGTAEVNGHAVALSNASALARAVENGAHVRLPDGASMTVAAPGRLAVEITPGSDAELTAPPSRWLGRIASARLMSGELRITTGERFHGARLAVRTPEAMVEVTGTTLAVIREPTGTCVCVMDGTVRVGAMRGGAMVPVPAGARRYVFVDGRPPEQAAMRPIERVKLGEMMERRPARSP